MKEDILEKIKKNVLNWYPIIKNSNVLIIGEEIAAIKDLFIQNKCNVFEKVDLQIKYDYIIVINCNCDIANLKNILNDKGIFLFIYNNKFGISNFTRFSYSERVQGIEQKGEFISRDNLYKDLKKNKYKYVNTYMVFPNYKQSDMIILDSENISVDKMEKYFGTYQQDDIIISNESSVLKEILKYDKDLFKKMANSYLIEASKEKIETDTKYVFYNNYRKKKYDLMTIIKSDVVEKKGTNSFSKKYINEIKLNMNELKKFKVKILDNIKDEMICSEFIEKETLDIVFAKNCNNLEYIKKILVKLKNILLENANKKVIKSELLEGEDIDKLNELNYLQYCFYDMVPKNCFYIENEFCFFDQEFMEKGLPVEFIIYRCVINCYDLVRNINIDELLEMLNILKYKEIFERLDNKLRKKIIDSEKLEFLTSNNKKMYEVIYQETVLQNQLYDLKINDEKQSIVIASLEENNKRQDDYIKNIEENNKKQDEYIKYLESIKIKKKNERK